MEQKIVKVIFLSLISWVSLASAVAGYTCMEDRRMISNTGRRFLEINVEELGRIRRDAYLHIPEKSRYEEGIGDLEIKGRLIGELYYYGTNLVIISMIYRTSERNFRESVEIIRSNLARGVAAEVNHSGMFTKESGLVASGLKWDVIEIRWPRRREGHFFVVNMYAWRDNVAYAIQYSANSHGRKVTKEDYISPEEFLRYVRVKNTR